VKHSFFIAGILLAVLGSAQAETFRWLDKSGNVHYGDQPSEEATQVEQKKFSNIKDLEQEDLPYATRMAQKNFPVSFYAFSKCGNPCQQARDFLNKRGIPFADNNLVSKEEMDAFKKKSGTDSVPALSVGKTWLKGFEADAWNSELDAAGYPKFPPYRPTPVKQPATKN